MNNRFKSIVTLGLVPVFVALTSSSCGGDDDPVIPEAGDTTIISDMDVPTEYAFESRFATGVSSVSYSGQVVRNMLLSDIKSVIGNEADEVSPDGVKTDVLALYNYDDASALSTLLSTGSFSLVEDGYSDISTGKNLSDKISNEIVADYGDGSLNAEALITVWLDSIDARIATGHTGSDIYVTADLVDLNQMINKLLLGSVTYYAGTNNYLTGLSDRNNVDPKSTDAYYTDREHGFDEAFGYFGAARDYTSFTDDDLASKNGGVIYKDANGDGSIDLNSEYNFGFSTNAGKRDRVGTTVAPDFTSDAFNAFLACRTAIANERSDEEIDLFAEAAANTWEKVIAATAVHYINDLKADLDAYEADPVAAKEDLAKHFGEMKGFTLVLAYGSSEFQLISAADLSDVNDLMGDAPDVDDITSYKADLDEAANILRLVYNFEQDNVDNWRPSN
jgi:hypothetical protein